MSNTLNLLPNGEPSPFYLCTAINPNTDEEKTVVLTEWWYDYKKIESIENSANSYFYDVFDKGPFEIISIKKLTDDELIQYMSCHEIVGR